MTLFGEQVQLWAAVRSRLVARLQDDARTECAPDELADFLKEAAADIQQAADRFVAEIRELSEQGTPTEKAEFTLLLGLYARGQIELGELP